ncbi:MAG: hypothetical protein OET63_18060 [Desulfobacterales bacterium]|jgi:hypothetical protein|nr:hypothetical protein [Desulfobacterales bacterium]
MVGPHPMGMTNFVNGQTNICKSAKIDLLNPLAYSGILKIFKRISVIYKCFKEKFIMAQLLLRYTPNILMNYKGGMGSG